MMIVGMLLLVGCNINLLVPVYMNTSRAISYCMYTLISLFSGVVYTDNYVPPLNL